MNRAFDCSSGLPDWRRVRLRGTVNQVEWAEDIRQRVDREFDRVSRALANAAAGASDGIYAETATLLNLLEEKRAEVLSHDEAGYFIREWQEMSGRVSQLIVRDPRYRAARATYVRAR